MAQRLTVKYYFETCSNKVNFQLLNIAMYKFKSAFVYSIILFFGFIFTQSLFAQDTTQYIEKNRTNTKVQQDKPYVILISADGFRYDFARRYDAKNLIRLANTGVEATSMKPSFPTLTFPNHYSIATGLYPAHHGIVSNRFYDPARKEIYALGKKESVEDGTWYGGTPLWVLAEKQQMVSASFFWVGSESDVQKTRPTYYFKYSEVFKFDRRLQILKEWLALPADRRPHLITFYFPEVDHAAHSFGVYSKETEEAVHILDRSIGEMNKMCAATGLPINFVFVSDHGFTDVDTVNTLTVPPIDTSKFLVSTSSNLVQIYAKEKKDIVPAYNALKKLDNHYTTYLAENVPADWHYGELDDYYNRVGDIILASDEPFIFYSRGRKSPATHGFDNKLQEMQATFYAWGPAFKKNLKINNFENVHVYPMIAKILGLTFDPESIDGRVEVLEGILK
jgi:predicted AlkP superfamily pyrophosphatase or phosphodiesterase